MTELHKQIKQYIDTHIGYNRKQYYKMIADTYSISQKDAKEYVGYILDGKIGVR